MANREALVFADHLRGKRAVNRNAQCIDFHFVVREDTRRLGIAPLRAVVLDGLFQPGDVACEVFVLVSLGLGRTILRQKGTFLHLQDFGIGLFLLCGSLALCIKCLQRSDVKRGREINPIFFGKFVVEFLHVVGHFGEALFRAIRPFHRHTRRKTAEGTVKMEHARGGIVTLERTGQLGVGFGHHILTQFAGLGFLVIATVVGAFGKTDCLDLLHTLQYFLPFKLPLLRFVVCEFLTIPQMIGLVEKIETGLACIQTKGRLVVHLVRIFCIQRF